MCSECRIYVIGTVRFNYICLLLRRTCVHVFCSKPSQGKEGTIHKVLPAPTPQTSQHHWDEAKPGTHRWKPASVHLQKQAAGWQHGWPSIAEDGPACNSLAPAPPFAGTVASPTLRLPPACMFGNSNPTLVPENGNPGKKPPW